MGANAPFSVFLDLARWSCGVCAPRDLWPKIPRTPSLFSWGAT